MPDPVEIAEQRALAHRHLLGQLADRQLGVVPSADQFRVLGWQLAQALLESMEALIEQLFLFASLVS